MGYRLHKKVVEALKETGAVRVRQNKHLVYELPNKAKVVLSATQRNTETLWPRQVKDIFNASKGIGTRV